jgi:tetratricopeptide (TPR) repeat protein
LTAEGEFALVRQILEPAVSIPAESVGDHDLYAMLVDVAALQRDAVAILKYAPQAEELATRHGHVLYHAIAHRAWGVAHRLAGAYGEAHTRLSQALALFTRLNTRWQIGRTLFELGELASAEGNAGEARDCFNRALAAFEALRAAPDAAQTRARLVSLQEQGQTMNYEE